MDREEVEGGEIAEGGRATWDFLVPLIRRHRTLLIVL